jgi:hypothetical protein
MLDLASVLPPGCAENDPLHRTLRIDTTVDILSFEGGLRESAPLPLFTTQDECRVRGVKKPSRDGPHVSR